MQVNGIPNKFKVFQEFYFQIKGVEISYREALRLFYQMDDDTEMDFIEYYATESGISIQYKQVQQRDKDGNLVFDDDGEPVYDYIPMDPFKFSDGFNLNDNTFVVTETGETKTKKRPKRDADGNVMKDADGNTIYEEYEVNVWANNRASFTKALLATKFTIEAYAAQRGIVLDPIWGQYSAEEIIQMENDGVDIPQEVLDVAHSIYESSPDNLENGEDTDGQGEKTAEKTPFLDLIPQAKKNIEKCNDTNDKIEDKIDDLMEENAQTKRSLIDKIEEQRASLKEYEEKIREWRKLQDKINNGEALTDSEARKYAQITGMLQDRNSNDSDFKLDKFKIAMNLSEINVLAVLGEKLADETVEIGENLEDYTCKKNYKSTARTTMGQIGFLRTIIAMILGKRLGEEAVKAGNDTKEYTDESADSVRDIAQLMGVEKMIANPSTETTDAPQDEAEQDVVDDATEEVQTETAPAEDAPVVDEEQETEDVQEKTEGENTEQAETEEDFIVNDDNVLGLIGETIKIDADLAKQIVVALSDWKAAKDDAAFAKFATKLIERMVAEYQEEEARRQQEIETKQQEIEETQKKIDELGGEEKADEGKKTAEQYGVKVDENDEENPEDNDEIAKYQEIIEQNTQDIESLKEESAQAIEKVKQRTAPIKEKVDKAVVDEAKALENDTKYKDEIIPADQERVDFTDASGETLMKMGKYRVIVGHEMIAASLGMGYLFVLGTRHVVKGTKSMFIGGAAKIVSNTKIPEISEKATGKAVEKEGKAIEGLNALDAKIIEVTGEQAAEDNVVETEEDENSEVAEDTEGTQEGAENGETSSETDAPVEDTVTANPEDFQPAEMPIDEPLQDDVQGTEADKKDALNADETFENAEDAAEDVPEATAEMPSESVSGSTGGSKSEASPEDEAKAAGSDAKKEEKAQKKQTDKQSKDVKDTNKSAKDDAKESKKIEKDEKKDAKQLEKEAKKIEQSIKKDEQEVIKLTKESQDAAQRQTELLTRYEEVIAENETLAAQEEQKQMSKPAQVQQPQNSEQQNGGIAMNSAGMADSSMGNTSDNAAKLEANNQVITELSGQFTIAGNKINRNKVRITKIEKSIKKQTKKFQKKVKTKQKKIKQTQKKEQQKQKRLQKQLAAVGIAENIFSITGSTGTIMSINGEALATAGQTMIATGTPMLSNPFTAAAGAALIACGTILGTNGATVTSVGQILEKIGMFGTLACGVTKATINIANGNLAAGLMALGQTAIAAVSSMTGTGSAANSVFGTVSQGLSIVSNSAQLVNNVRAVQGKEASGVMSKIGTVAGVGSAVTGAAAGFAGGGFKDASALGKVAQIGSAAGTVMTSASQIMTEFKLGDEKTANILGSVGGGLSTVSSVTQLATKLKNKDNGTDNVNNETEGDDNTNPAGSEQDAATPPEGYTQGEDGKFHDSDGRTWDPETGKTYDTNGQEIDPTTGKPVQTEQQKAEKKKAEEKKKDEKKQVAEKSDEKVAQIASTQLNSNSSVADATLVAAAVDVQSQSNETKQQDMNAANDDNSQTVQQSDKDNTDKTQKTQIEQQKTDQEIKETLEEVEQLDHEIKAAEDEQKNLGNEDTKVAETEEEKAEENKTNEEKDEDDKKEKPSTLDKITKGAEILGGLGQAASSIMSASAQSNTTQKKKQGVVFAQTERFKKIRRERLLRVNALAKSQRYYA